MMINARRRDESGASAVEFALVLLPLIVIVFGMIDLAAGFCNIIQVDQSAQAAARLAGFGYTQSDATTRMNFGAQFMIGSTTPSISSYSDCSGGATQASVTVTSIYTPLVKLPLIPALNHDITIKQTGVMACTN